MGGTDGLLGKAAAHEVGTEVGGRAQELAPLEKAAVGLARREKRDVEAGGEDRRREDRDSGAGTAKARPDRGDERRREKKDQVDPDKLKAADEPGRAVFQKGAKGDEDRDRRGENGVEGDRDEKWQRPSRRRLELGRIEVGSARRRDGSRQEVVARDHEEDAVAPRAQEVHEAQDRGRDVAQVEVDVQPTGARELGKPGLEGVEQRDARDGRQAQHLDRSIARRGRARFPVAHLSPSPAFP